MFDPIKFSQYWGYTLHYYEAFKLVNFFEVTLLFSLTGIWNHCGPFSLEQQFNQSSDQIAGPWKSSHRLLFEALHLIICEGPKRTLDCPKSTCSNITTIISTSHMAWWCRITPVNRARPVWLLPCKRLHLSPLRLRLPLSTDLGMTFTTSYSP